MLWLKEDNGLETLSAALDDGEEFELWRAEKRELLDTLPVPPFVTEEEAGD